MAYYVSHMPAFEHVVVCLQRPKVCAPPIYEKALHLVALWSLKAELSAGHPFAAFQDMHNTALDIILTAAFGFGDDQSVLKREWDALTNVGPAGLRTPANAEAAMEFPLIDPPAEPHALATISDSISITFFSATPLLSHWYAKQTRLRKHLALKNKVVWREIDRAVDRLFANGFNQEAATCALDRMLIRELANAKKDGRKPEFKTARVHDEVLPL